MEPPPELNVVVYRAPGPGEDEIASHSREIFTALALLDCEIDAEPSGQPEIGPVGYVTLVERDFDKVWKGVSRGEMRPAAFGIILLLGPKAREYIVNHEAFTFGWMDHHDETYGETLLLSVYRRDPLSTPWN